MAALSLGAVGVQMGTRFVCAKECTVHPNYKASLIKAKIGYGSYGYHGHQVRVIKNKLTKGFTIKREKCSCRGV